MQDFKRKLYLLLLPGLILSGCKKEVQVNEDVILDRVVYGVNDVDLYSSSAEKTKQKNSTQFISIAYADLYKTAIAGNQLTKLSELALSIGDKQMANEIFVGGFINDPNVKIPTKEDMLLDIDKFIEDTYIRFYLRKPTELEMHYFRNFINNDPDITPEIIYTAFTRSNEYWFY